MEDKVDTLGVLCTGKYEWIGGSWKHSRCRNARTGGPDNIGKYCGHHEQMGKRYEDSLNGIVHCINVIRGCPKIIEPSSRFKRCEDCRSKDRPNDRKRTRDRQAVHIRQKAEGLSSLDCGTCGNPQLAELYLNQLGRPTTKCVNCLERQRKVDEKRRARPPEKRSKHEEKLEKLKNKSM